MAVCERLKSFFGEKGARYELVVHPEEFSAERVAQVSHLPGRDVVKVVVMRDEGDRPLMAVLPAPCRVDVAALAEESGHGSLVLAHEPEIQDLFPDCELGAMPPFGNLYGMPVYVDACFPRTHELFFQAGNHRELIGMAYQEYNRLAHPTIREFCLHHRFPRRNH
jgi:Ala-tRNA(Pro) deacylase